MGKEPTVWLVLGDKLGDNAQVEVVADALDWPVERKRLVCKEQYVIGKPAFRPSLYHLDLPRSDALTPPWPDLVLTIGRRPSMAALWIKRQSAGKTKLVLFGRPRRYAREFDLVIIPPQYFMPAGSNVLQLELPLMRISKKEVEQHAMKWKERLGKMPRPLVGVFIGGVTRTYACDGEVARDLLDKVRKSMGGEGTIYLSTSRRTPQEVVETLVEHKPDNAVLYRWGMDDEQDNPYRALLAYADGCVVTSDSISMMVEVVRMDRPLAIYGLPVTWTWRDKMKLKFGEFIARFGLSAWLYDKGWEFGGRDLEAFQERFIRRGWAVELTGKKFPYPARSNEVPDEVAKVVGRIRSLFG